MNKKEFKNYINSHYQSNPNVKGIKVNGNEDYYVAKVDFGPFEQCVIVCPSTDYKSYDMIALSYKIYGYKNIVSIYDLLAFLEIDDYNVYTFKTLLDEDSLNKVLDLYDSLSNQYYSFLKSLSTDSAMQDRMTNMLIESLCLERLEDERDYKDLKKEALKELSDLEASEYSSMMYVNSNNGKRSKTSVIKALSKCEDRLDVYEKRALNYLRNGGELPKPVLNFDKNPYGKYILKTFAIVILIAFVPLIAVAVRYAVVFGGGYIPKEALHMPIGLGLLGVLAFAFAIFVLLFDKILKLVTPKSKRDSVLDLFYKRAENERGLQIVSKQKDKSFLGIANRGVLIFAAVAGIIFGVILMIGINDGFALYDEYVKFDGTGEVVSVKYQDLDVYSVDGMINADDNFEEVKGRYAFVSGKNYYVLDDVKENSKTEKLILEKSTEIKNVKTLEDIEGIDY